jgi:hypothetical protein
MGRLSTATLLVIFFGGLLGLRTEAPVAREMVRVGDLEFAEALELTDVERDRNSAAAACKSLIVPPAGAAFFAGMPILEAAGRLSAFLGGSGFLPGAGFAGCLDALFVGLDVAAIISVYSSPSCRISCFLVAASILCSITSRALTGHSSQNITKFCLHISRGAGVASTTLVAK